VSESTGKEVLSGRRLIKTVSDSRIGVLCSWGRPTSYLVILENALCALRRKNAAQVGGREG